MATRRASDSGLSGKKYNDASAGGSKIADVPNPPTAVSAVNVGTSRAFNNGAATVTVTPDAVGGTPTSYTVTPTPTTSPATFSGSSPITVTNLASNTSYTFAATATTASGTSGASPASSSITATTVPDAPTMGTATKVNATTVSISFTPPSNGGSAITGYTIVSSPSVSLTTASGTTSPLTATGTFGAGSSYTFTIAAINANGTSAASAASNSLSMSNGDFSYTAASAGTIYTGSINLLAGTYALNGNGKASVSFIDGSNNHLTTVYTPNSGNTNFTINATATKVGIVAHSTNSQQIVVGGGGPAPSLSANNGNATTTYTSGGTHNGTGWVYAVALGGGYGGGSSGDPGYGGPGGDAAQDKGAYLYINGTYNVGVAGPGGASTFSNFVNSGAQQYWASGGGGAGGNSWQASPGGSRSSFYPNVYSGGGGGGGGGRSNFGGPGGSGGSGSLGTGGNGSGSLYGSGSPANGRASGGGGGGGGGGYGGNGTPGYVYVRTGLS